MITKHILILEDVNEEPPFLHHSIKQLHRTSYTFHIVNFSDPIAAIRFVNEQWPIDLALISIGFSLSNLTGFHVASAIRGLPEYDSTKIIFISALEHYRMLAFQQYHYYAFLSKPYDEEALLHVVEAALQLPPYLPAMSFNRLLTIPVVRTRRSIILPCDEISCLEKNDRVITVHYKNGTRIEHTITNGTFRRLRRNLPLHPSAASLLAMPMIEIHCSIIINVEAVTEVLLVLNNKNSPHIKVQGCEIPFPIAKEHLPYMKQLFRMI